MSNQDIKEAEMLPLSVVNTGKTTKQGSKIYNCNFEMQPGLPAWSASAFSDTVAQDLEKAIAEKRKVKIGYTESTYNGQVQYNIKSVDGKSNSGFKKGQGFQKDTVSIERQASAKLAVEAMQFLPGQKDVKALKKTFIDLADHIYVWISARPSEPLASGGATEQKEPAPSDADAPIDLNDLPPEYR